MVPDDCWEMIADYMGDQSISQVSRELHRRLCGRYWHLRRRQATALHLPPPPQVLLDTPQKCQRITIDVPPEEPCLYMVKLVHGFSQARYDRVENLWMVVKTIQTKMHPLADTQECCILSGLKEHF